MPTAHRPESPSLPLFDGMPPTAADSRTNALACFESDTSLFDRIAPLFRRAALEQAQSLREALARGDEAAVRHWAHTLKGSLLTVGARQIARHASEIEQSAREQGLDGLEPAVMRLVGETRVIADHLSPPT